MNNIEEAYKAYFNEIYKFCFYRLGNKENAEDISSEVFAKLSTQDLSKINNLRAWLYKVARNEIYDKYVKTPNIQDSLELDPNHEFNFQDKNINVENYVFEKDFLERIQKELYKIDSITADIIVMKVWDELPFPEISVITNLNVEAVKKRFQRGILKIKNNLLTSKNMETNNVSTNLPTNPSDRKSFLHSKSLKYAISFFAIFAVLGIGVFGAFSYYKNNEEVAKDKNQDKEIIEDVEDKEEPEEVDSYESNNLGIAFDYPKEYEVEETTRTRYIGSERNIEEEVPEIIINKELKITQGDPEVDFTYSTYDENINTTANLGTFKINGVSKKFTIKINGDGGPSDNCYLGSESLSSHYYVKISDEIYAHFTINLKDDCREEGEKRLFEKLVDVIKEEKYQKYVKILESISIKTATNLQSDWSTEKISECGVSIPVPPQTGEYVKTDDANTEVERKWDVLNVENASKPLVRYGKYIRYAPFFKATNNIAQPDGYLPGVMVLCSRVPSLHYTYEDFKKDYRNSESAMEEGVPAETYRVFVSKGTRQLFGETVHVIDIQGGMFNDNADSYLLIKNNYRYIITGIDMEGEDFVSKTVQKIFNGIVFTVEE